MAKIKLHNIGRTLILGMFLTGALIWSAIYRFDVQPQELLGFAGMSLLLLLLLIVCAAAAAGLLVLIRRWRE